ncbi:MAG TPA: hypothetical protein VFO55_05175 [Gemmatimonadaceae bacterium]|nr:hypothetical protein [Gemmatimonadaceae bacterium]
MTETAVQEPGPAPRPEQVEPNRGWKKLILALVAFVLAPSLIPQVRAFVPVDETMMLFVPAMAACSLVGWWAGGRAFSAIVWVVLAFVVARQQVASTDVYANLLRGWTLLLAGAFGLACLLGPSRPFFTKALTAVGAAFGLALLMSLFGPVTLSATSDAIAGEFARRNAEFLEFLNRTITTNGAQWQQWTERMPSLAALPADAGEHLTTMSRAGRMMFPALLALESLAALALAWAAYHRLSRRRIGAPLALLREFRFNDQFVWGLIVGLVILLLPSLEGARGLGRNLVLFFGALYAIRGLGVLAWFMAPGVFAMSLIAGAVLVLVPVVNVIAILGFMTLGVTALGLGVGDTWADWRSRAAARSTLS